MLTYDQWIASCYTCDDEPAECELCGEPRECDPECPRVTGEPVERAEPARAPLPAFQPCEGFTEADVPF